MWAATASHMVKRTLVRIGKILCFWQNIAKMRILVQRRLNQLLPIFTSEDGVAEKAPVVMLNGACQCKQLSEGRFHSSDQLFRNFWRYWEFFMLLQQVWNFSITAEFNKKSWLGNIPFTKTRAQSLTGHSPTMTSAPVNDLVGHFSSSAVWDIIDMVDARAKAVCDRRKTPQRNAILVKAEVQTVRVKVAKKI